MADSREMQVPPLLIVPMTACTVGATHPVKVAEDITVPMVLLQLSNAVAMAQYPMDVDQARALRDNIDRAIIDAQYETQRVRAATPAEVAELRNHHPSSG